MAQQLRVEVDQDIFNKAKETIVSRGYTLKEFTNAILSRVSMFKDAIEVPALMYGFNPKAWASPYFGGYEYEPYKTMFMGQEIDDAKRTNPSLDAEFKRVADETGVTVYVSNGGDEEKDLRKHGRSLVALRMDSELYPGLWQCGMIISSDDLMFGVFGADGEMYGKDNIFMAASFGKLDWAVRYLIELHKLGLIDTRSGDQWEADKV